MTTTESGREYFDRKLRESPAIQALGKDIRDITPLDIMELPPIPGLKRLGGLSVSEVAAERARVYEASEEFLNMTPQLIPSEQ